MLRKRYRFLLIQELKKTIRKHLKESLNPGKLSVFSYPGILDSFLDPLLEMNWYVHDSTELPSEDFTVSYIVRFAKRPHLAELKLLISPGEQALLPFITHHSFLLTTYQVKERILTFKIMA